MSVSREKIYRCTLVTRSRTLEGLVRAWDDQEAALLFREELEETGVTVRGRLLVRDLSKQPTRPAEQGALVSA